MQCFRNPLQRKGKTNEPSVYHIQAKQSDLLLGVTLSVPHCPVLAAVHHGVKPNSGQGWSEVKQKYSVHRQNPSELFFLVLLQ